VLPLALVAAALALLAPWRDLADRSEWLLAALVVLTALGIAPSEIAAVRRLWPAVLALSVLPFVILAPAAWALSRLFDGPIRDGTVALGLAPTEVASWRWLWGMPPSRWRLSRARWWSLRSPGLS
jgi:predicted Na+-dependent transporter